LTYPHETAPVRSFSPPGPGKEKQKKTKTKKQTFLSAHLPIPIQNQSAVSILTQQKLTPSFSPASPSATHKHLLQTKSFFSLFYSLRLRFLFVTLLHRLHQIVFSSLPHHLGNHLPGAFDARGAIPTQKKHKD
jgi:hypothetical protein